MLERLEGSFEAQRRFTADASHELRSPLTALRGEIELALRRDRDTAEYRRVLESNLQEVDRLTTWPRTSSPWPAPTPASCSPGSRPPTWRPLSRTVLDRLRGKAASGTWTCARRVPSRVEALVDPGLFEQLLWNLVDNAVKFSPAERPWTWSSAKADHGHRLDVADRGPGIPPGTAAQIFDRFFRADPARTAGETGGTGLGLAIVQAIAEAHGGSVAANRRGGGAVFTVPAPLPLPTAGAPFPSRHHRPGGCRIPPRT
jgi:two-component system, OmpR family, sensor kinase